MLRSYLKIAYRNLKRHKGYAFINVFGLAVGLAACLLIGLFVLHELSYDRFHPNADRVYRIEHAAPPGEAGIPSAGQGLAYIFETQFPEVEHATEVFIPASSVPVTLDGEHRHLEDVVTADESFLDVFPYELLRGNPETALAAPNRLVLTESAARRLFGDRDPIGQTVRIRDEADYTVTGIVEDVPQNAHFRFQALLSLSEERRQKRYDSDVLWVGFGFFLYVELREGSNPEALEEKIKAYVKASDAPEYYRSRERFFVAQPVTAIHLHSNFEPGIAPQGDVRYLYLFSIIGLIILAIAVINYVNLATARSAGRAREVGVRKVVGAHRRQLVGQFLSEAALMSLAAFLLAVALAHLALPYVNGLTGQPLHLGLVAGGPGWLMALGVVLAVGVGAGLYPALFLSGFQPVRVLRGRGLVGSGGHRLRQALTIFQFVASIALIIGTLVVQFQLDYVRSKRLGFDKEQVVTLSASRLGERYPAFKQAVQEHAAIQSVTSGPPMGVGSRSLPVPVMQGAGEPQFLHVFDVDHDYLERRCW